MCFDEHPITIIEHEYLFQVTKMLGHMVTPTSCHHGHRGHQSHHSPGHCGHHNHCGLKWPLDVMVTHKKIGCWSRKTSPSGNVSNVVAVLVFMGIVHPRQKNLAIIDVSVQ
jgi:hypothetical protein